MKATCAPPQQRPQRGEARAGRSATRCPLRRPMRVRGLCSGLRSPTSCCIPRPSSARAAAATTRGPQQLRIAGRSSSSRSTLMGAVLLWAPRRTSSSRAPAAAISRGAPAAAAARPLAAARAWAISRALGPAPREAQAGPVQVEQTTPPRALSHQAMRGTQARIKAPRARPPRSPRSWALPQRLQPPAEGPSRSPGPSTRPPLQPS